MLFKAYHSCKNVYRRKCWSNTGAILLMMHHKWESFIEHTLKAHGYPEEEIENLASRHCHCPLEEEGEEVCEEVTVNGSVVARLWMKRQYWMEAIAND